MSETVHIINLGQGNISSVQRAVQTLGVQTCITNSVNELQSAERIILPGVGHYDLAMNFLRNNNLLAVLKQHIQDNKPLLGICLGMQLLANESEEGNTKGLGIFDAEVKQLKTDDSMRWKIPHNGWNTLTIKSPCALLEGISETDELFFLHQYYWKSAPGNEVHATTRYDSEFASVIGKDNVWGVQFHPEKSHAVGLRILSNFLNL